MYDYTKTGMNGKQLDSVSKDRVGLDVFSVILGAILIENNVTFGMKICIATCIQNKCSPYSEPEPSFPT